MIAISYALFGITALSALGVVKFFCILNPVVLYYFGKKTFGHRVGLASAFLIISSYSICFWSFQFIDAIWPFFVILHCYCLFIAFEQDKNKNIYFVLAGLFLGIALLTKEVSLLFFPLGLLMFSWIKEYQYRKNFLGIIVSLLITLFVLLPWVVYLQRHDALSFLWGTGGPVVFGDITNTLSQPEKGGQFYNIFLGVLTVLKRFFAAFVYFYSGQTNTVTVNFTVAPLFLVSWCFIVLHAFRGHKGCKILILCLLLFLPIIYFIGNNHWRFGQVLFIMLFSYIALSYTLFRVVGWVGRRTTVSASVTRAGFFIVVFTFVVVQVFVQKEKDLGLANFFQKTTLYHFITENEYVSPAITGSFVSPYLSRIVEKIKNVSHGQGAVLADSFWTSRNIFIQLMGEQYVYAFPMVWCRKGEVILGESPADNSEKPLYVSSNNLPLEPQYRLYFLFESQLVKLLRTKQIGYIVLSPTFPSLNKYFSSSERYDLLLKVGQPGSENRTYYVYRVKKESEDERSTDTIFSDNVVLTLNKLFKNNPERYRRIRDLFLYKFASLTEHEVSSMMQSVDNIPEYHAEIGNKYYEEGNVLQAIEEYKEAIRLDPVTVRYYCELGRLLFEVDQFEPAFRYYEKALQLAPDNTGVIFQLGRLYWENNQPKKAIEKLLEAVTLDPKNSDYHYLLGVVYKESGFLEKAQIQLETAIHLDSEKGAYHRFLGDLYKQTGKQDKAIEQYQVAIKLEPKNSGYRYLLGAVYQEAGLLDKAQVHFETAVDLEPENAWYHRFLGQLYELVGEPEKALEQYQQAVSLNSENTSFRYLLGNLYRTMDQPLKALEQYRELVRLDPENSQYQKLVEQFEVDHASDVQ